MVVERDSGSNTLRSYRKVGPITLSDVDQSYRIKFSLTRSHIRFSLDSFNIACINTHEDPDCFQLLSGTVPLAARKLTLSVRRSSDSIVKISSARIQRERNGLE